MIKGILKNRRFLEIVVVLAMVLGINVLDAGADFDGDGRADVFVVTGGKVYRYEATGLAGGLEFVPEAFTVGVTAVAVGNFDNDADGKGDLLMGRYAADAKPGAKWWEPLGGKSLVLIHCKFGSNVQANGVAICSGSDGSSDLYLRRDGSISRYRCEKDNEFKSSKHGMTSGVQCLAGGDINRDNGYDLLVGKNSSLAWYQSESGVLTKKQDFNGQNFKALAIGNLDSDVYPDIVAVVDANGASTIKWFESSGKDTVTLTEIDIRLKNNSGFSSIAMGDVDGDGVGELLATQSSGPVRWFVCNGNNSVTELSVPAFGENAIGIAIASSDPIASWPEKADDRCCLNVGDVSEIKIGEDTKKIKVVESHVVTTNKEDLNFPQFRISQAGEYAIAYGTGPHAKTGWFKMSSTDNGKTWVSNRPLPGLLATLEIGGEKTISMGYRSAATDNPRVLTNRVIESTDNWQVHKPYKSTLTFPFDIGGFAFVRSMILAANGTTIYAAGQASRAGSIHGESMMLESDDSGITWTYRSTIAARTEEWMGVAGPSETAMVRLTNGDLLAVMRTGSMSLPWEEPPATCPMACVISSDDGATWGTPANMQCTGVFPDMAVLKNGMVIVLSGRPGVYVRLATPDGMTWSEPLYIFEGMGCANSSMQLDSDGMPVIVYTESDFCGNEYPGYTNYLKMVKLQIGD